MVHLFRHETPYRDFTVRIRVSSGGLRLWTVGRLCHSHSLAAANPRACLVGVGAPPRCRHRERPRTTTIAETIHSPNTTLGYDMAVIATEFL